MQRKRKLVCGVGINDADYVVQPTIDCNTVLCPFYTAWHGMIRRAYDAKFHATQPTYADVTVCGEWLSFMTFKAWMEKQDWQGKELDKDIIKPGNKHYSPENCCFVTKILNCLLADSRATRGEHPIGVYYDKNYGKYRARCSDGTGKRKQLGYFDTSSAAHSAWVKFKSNFIANLAAKQIDCRISNGLMRHAAFIATQ